MIPCAASVNIQLASGNHGNTTVVSTESLVLVIRRRSGFTLDFGCHSGNRLSGLIKPVGPIVFTQIARRRSSVYCFQLSISYT